MIVPLLFAVDFMNFTYKTNPCVSNVPVAVVMRKGEFSYLDKKMAVSFYLSVDSVKRGSLQKGTHQAAVALECDYPVGGTASTYLFDEHGDRAVLLGEIATADWSADWGEGPRSMQVRFANNLLYVQQCADPDCTKKTRTIYALRAGKLTKVSGSSR